MDGIASVYTDASLCYDPVTKRANPSPIGGAWAAVYVDERGRKGFVDFGRILPSDFGEKEITNNLVETIAVIHALENLPDGWSGKLFSDSNTTIRRVTEMFPGSGPVSVMRHRLAYHLSRLGPIQFILCKGHATLKELAAGVSKEGLPASEYNTLADVTARGLCRKEVWDEYVKQGREACGHRGR